MGQTTGTLRFGPIELRLDERRLRVEGQTVALGSRGFDLLKALVVQRDRVVTKDELLDQVWPGLVVEENNLQVQISGLRRVLGAQAIATVAGVGYRFTLAEHHTDTPAAAPLPPAQPALAPARVLVADDNKVNRLLLARSIELMGHQVTSTDNGVKALALMREQRFELLLLDLAMPELDGFGVLQARAQDPALCEVAVIVTSALAGVAPVARCIEWGADDFLHKPVDPWLLKARVESSLRGKRQRDQSRDTLRRLVPGGNDQTRRLPAATVLAAHLQAGDGVARPPQALVEDINRWCTLMFDAIDGHSGEVMHFSGDAFTALFDTPDAALAAAGDMASLMRQFNAARQAEGLAPLAAGIGIAQGPVVLGLAGTPQRMACACIGAPVGRARQLASQCAGAGHPVLVDDAARATLATPVGSQGLQAPDGSMAHTWPWP